MPKNALLLHGTDASPDSNWLPWLKNQLAWRGYEVAAPQLPNPEAPDMDRYWETLKDYPWDSETVIVGHSSGGVAALEVLARLPDAVVVKHVICVAAFYKDEGWGTEGMFRTEFDWGRIKAHAQKIELWWAPDDAYISEEQTTVLSERLGVKPRIFDAGYGHFNIEVSEKFRQLPELMDAIIH